MKFRLKYGSLNIIKNRVNNLKYGVIKAKIKNKKYKNPQTKTLDISKPYWTRG